MKRLSNKSWVLVADGARALVLRNDGDAEYPNLKLVRSYGQDNPSNHQQGSEKPGRTNDSLGRRSAMEATDWHQIAEDRFVQQIAEAMAKDLAVGAFDKLVIAAPPVALGEFRKAVSPAVAKATILEIDKDLTKHPLHEIEKLIVKALDEASFKR
ncbi:MAG TPA: host attachment family protein [Aestuariivirga sp.]|nr:host attachment family protein [Aestuariivirga sp.]